MNPAADIERLLSFALGSGFISCADVPLARNSLLEALALDEPDGAAPEIPEPSGESSALPVLRRLVDYALERGIVANDTETERDLFDTRLMGCLMPRPSEVVARFEAKERDGGAAAACDWFYDFCIKSGYIRADRVARNIEWEHESAYGAMRVTINLSKPEKDPREVARLRTLPQAGYPKCQLCLSNVGYRGRLNHPARQTLRVLPVRLNGERWYFQYSPYVYYPQHCIVLREEHSPMKICRETFVRLVEFLGRFPHYFIGSNAGLPIVGGSILNHDHFQGGVWTMPMSKAPVFVPLRQHRWPGLEAGIVRWPMSVLRLRHADPAALVDAAAAVLGAWEGYSDYALGIHACTGGTPHNAVTPIARRRGEDYELDFVLRNNRTDDRHKLGIFHVHDDLHHIKKENIGLIEVMGLFILPGRLEAEFGALADILCGAAPFDRAALERPEHPLNKHLPWLLSMLAEHGTVSGRDGAMAVIKAQCGEKCVRVLEDCGVYKDNAEGLQGFLRFLETAGFLPKEGAYSFPGGDGTFGACIVAERKEEVVRKWKEIQEKYRPLLRPGKRPAAEVLTHIASRYPLEPFSSDGARRAVEMNAGLGRAGTPGPADVRMYTVRDEGEGRRLYARQRQDYEELKDEFRETLGDAVDDTPFEACPILVGAEMNSGFVYVEGSPTLAEEALLFQGLGEEEMENAYVVAHYVRVLEKHGRLNEILS